jgi:hypothetical protein
MLISLYQCFFLKKSGVFAVLQIHIGIGVSSCVIFVSSTFVLDLFSPLFAGNYISPLC